MWRDANWMARFLLQMENTSSHPEATAADFSVRLVEEDSASDLLRQPAQKISSRVKKLLTCHSNGE